MDINDLTLKQVKEIAALVGCASIGSSAPSSASPFVGKYVICRCYAAGVHAGELVSQNGDVVQLKNSRRLWQWTAKQGVALSGLAVHGLKTGKVDVVLPDIILVGVCETIPCSAVAEASINGFA